MASSDKAVIVGSLRDMLYKKRMERQLLAAKGLIAGPERPPGEEVRGAGAGGAPRGPPQAGAGGTARLGTLSRAAAGCRAAHGGRVCLAPG